jgi:hypothetical protein
MASVASCGRWGGELETGGGGEAADEIGGDRWEREQRARGLGLVVRLERKR